MINYYRILLKGEKFFRKHDFIIFRPYLKYGKKERKNLFLPVLSIQIII